MKTAWFGFDVRVGLATRPLKRGADHVCSTRNLLHALHGPAPLSPPPTTTQLNQPTTSSNQIKSQTMPRPPTILLLLTLFLSPVIATPLTARQNLCTDCDCCNLQYDSCVVTCGGVAGDIACNKRCMHVLNDCLYVSLALPFPR